MTRARYMVVVTSLLSGWARYARSMAAVPMARRHRGRPRHRWLLAGAVLLCATWAVPAHAAARVQFCTGSNNSSAGTSVTCTWPSATTAGNALIAILVQCNNGFVTPTMGDSGWTQAGAQKDNANLRVRVYYNLNSTSRSTSTWTFGSGTNATLYMVEYSGIGTNSWDISATNGGTSTAASTGTTGALAQAVEVAVGVVAVQGSGNTFSGESITEVTEKTSTDATFGMNSAFLESITNSTTGVGTNATITGSSANWAGLIQTFKATAGGGGTAGLWVGAQAGHLWSNTANWSNGALPASTDTVTMDGTGNNAMVIDQDATVAGFSVNSGYTSSITQSGTRNLTITGDLTLGAASGTFTAPSGLLLIGGAFTKTGAITFTHNSGTVLLNSTASKTLASNGATFNNLIINDGLVGYWKLDESTAGTAVDSSGYGNSATAFNTPVASATVPTLGFRDPFSESFTGTNGNTSTTPCFITGFMPAVLQPAIVTMSAWYRSTGVAASGGEIISGSNRYSLRVYSSTQIKVTKQTAAGTWVELTATAPTPLDGNWHHIAGVINGSGMFAYFDGVQVGSNADTSAIFYGTSVNAVVNSGNVGFFNFARNQDTSGYEFSGNIDEARVYNRALSATEINSLAKSRQPGTGLATQTLTGAPTFAGDLVIASGTLAAGANNITVSGDWWNYGGLFTSSANTVTMNGSGASYILSSGQMFSNLTFSGSGSVTLADRFETDPGSAVTVSAGTFALSSYTMRTGDINRNGAITITPNTGRVVFDANANQTIDTGTYNNLNIEPVTATELVGYWKMDDGQGTTVSDYSGNGNDGTLTNGPLWLTTGLPSAISFENPSALTFSGSTNPYVVTTGVLPTALKPSVVTVSAWYKATSVDTSGAEVVSGSNNYAIRVFSSTQIKVAKQTGASTWVELTATVSNPLDGNWHQLTGVISGTGMYAYFDGALAGSNGDTTAIFYTGTSGMLFGKNPATTGYQFTGSIDDVRVYNTALSAKQIAALAAGTYPAGLSNVPTYTLGNNSTVGGAFTQDGGTLNTSSYTMNVSSTGSAAAVNSGTYTLGSTTNTFAGGLTVGGNATLGMASSGGSLQVGSTKTLTINGTFNASSTAATIQTAGGAGTYYAFKVGSTATATPTLNINGLAVKNTDTNGMYINSNTSATTTFTRFDNIAFSSGTGTQLLQIYAPTLYLVSNGCTFDTGATATTTYDVTLTGNGSATETRALFGGATCASNKTSCEFYDNDDDANLDGVGDTTATNAAVIQWVTAAQGDTNGTIEGFPTAAFDWKFFTYYATYVLFHDVDSGTADRIYVRDASGNAKYSWDGPSGTDLIGAPRFDTDLTTDVHYVYAATASGKVYRLIDNGSSLTPDTTGNWASTNNPYDCSCTITTPLTLDATNLYWGGVLTAGSANKVWTLGKTSRAQAGGTPLTTTALVSGAAPALWTSTDTYLFVGESTHFDKLDVTSQALTTTNATPTGTVNGRISIINSKLFGADTAGKLWVLNPAATGLTTLWSYHDDVNHNGCTSGVCAVTGSLYVDYLLNRAFYGDSDGHLYASYNSAGTTGAQSTGFPYRPGTSSELYATAPFYNAGVMVAGTATGNVYVIDVNGGSGPVLLQTYKLGTTVRISGVGYDKTGGNYLISAADATLKNGDVFYLPAVTDPTPGSN